MDKHLVVVRPFGGRTRGETIVDPRRIDEILNGEHAACVVRVNTTATARKED